MTSVQEHYDQHLGPIYSWMVGGIESGLKRGSDELDAIITKPFGSGMAVDLGAGFGMHTIPLARRGFNVLAVDSCATLLDELQAQSGTLPIRTVQDDIQSFSQHLSGKADLVLCMGDTLTHIADKASVIELIAAVSAKTNVSGRFIITLRDYSIPLSEERRFIPVRSGDNRILTCFLEYTDSHVTVHDILHEQHESDWHMSISKYDKLRISPNWLAKSLQEHGFKVEQKAGAAGMLCFIAHRV